MRALRIALPFADRYRRNKRLKEACPVTSFHLPLRAVCLALMLVPAAAPAAHADLAGPYLAARIASAESDYSAASQYYSRALLSDPSNPLLQEATLISLLGLGDIDRALPVAQAMVPGKDGAQTAALVLLAADAAAGNFDALLARLDGGANTGPLIGGLGRAWALAGQGQMSDATRAFDKLISERGIAVFGRYHKALALAMVGDYEGADAIFAAPESEALHQTRRGAQAHIQVLSQLERNADALDLMTRIFGVDADPEMAAMRDALEAGEVLPFTVVTSAREGFAETFFTVASALNGETPDTFTLIHARLGQYLRPDHVDAVMLVAAILEQQKQFDLATAAYTTIPRDHPSYHAAELGRAEALMAADRPDQAIEVLEALSQASPDLASIWIALGDTYRRQERYSDASAAYDKAIEIFGEPKPEHWFVWYARAISQERSDRWTEAEAGFRKALELSPEQPQVLNYLGYSYVEKQENLDEALSMIERAVAARPEDGYIIDSLGWVLYRLGRYEEAVVQMERAVELMAIDALVNDHLGDVYWAVGRKREAEFQWKRALSFGPGDDLDMDRVRRKLEVGLDKVLADEGAEPLKASMNASN